jgi:hypothetical protein
MTKKTISQNTDRYTYQDGVWSISAGPDITPVTITKGTPIELKPLLTSDGIVVKVLGSYLISQNTLDTINESLNPHYDVIENGKIKKTPMGKTIPIIEVNVDKLKASIEERNRINPFAGVQSTTYVTDTVLVDGLPKGLIDQINYTLSEKESRPADDFSIYQLFLEGDYSIEKLAIETAQKDGILDQTKLDTFLKGVDVRRNNLTKDFNMIKEMFFLGRAPSTTQRTNSFTKVAMTSNPDEETERSSKNIVFKQVRTIGSDDTAVQKTQAEIDNVAKGTAQAIDDVEKRVQGEIDARNKTYDEIIAKWDGYSFTSVEKESLKNPKGGTKRVRSFFKTKTVQQSILNVIKGDKEININIEWLPTVLDKAKIHPKLYPTSNMFGPVVKKTKEKYAEYFGSGKTKIDYDRLNRDRKAELLSLANQIVEIEEQKGKTL